MEKKYKAIKEKGVILSTERHLAQECVHDRAVVKKCEEWKINPLIFL
jgi:hypothetical protein